MSYDLFFKPVSTPLNGDLFESYFSKRQHYTVSSGQAVYENEDTGVYFFFDYGADDAESLAFNLNYFRPHFFGLEAAPEVAAFVHAFALSVNDPQNDGMGDGPFSIEGFLRGWNSGNRFGYRAILEQDARPETFVYPTSDLERIWRWNLSRAALQQNVGDALFVPKFMFMKWPTMARSAVVWPDGCPIYMPKADLVIILRDELSTTPAASEPRQVTVIEWAVLDSLFKAFPYDKKQSHFRLEYDHPPSSVSDFVRSLPLVPHDRNLGLAFDNVLNAELVGEFTKSC